MQIKPPFFTQNKEEMTENAFRQVLLTSICGILLCMACLVGTTWAWFTVDLENTENVLQIGTPSVILTMDDTELTSGNKLAAAEHTIRVAHANDPDAFQNKSTLYVTFFLDGTVKGHLVLDSQNNFVADLNVNLGQEATFTWIASWFEPDAPGPNLSNGDAISLSAAEESGSADPTEASSTTATQGGTDSTDETGTASEPSVETTEDTESATEGSEESSQPTETTETTEATTAL